MMGRSEEARAVAECFHSAMAHPVAYDVEGDACVGKTTLWLTPPALPTSLSELVHSRLDRLGEDTGTVLLAAACVGSPTVDLLADVIGAAADRIVDVLDVPLRDGLVRIEDGRILFTHPLLAHAVYSDAGPARRTMHRCLADVVIRSDVRDRYLAASEADPATLRALDAAAATARAQGAPAAAAELLDVAIGLGGDEPARRIRAADHHFRAGDVTRADELLIWLADDLPAGALRVNALNLLAALRIHHEDFSSAIDLLHRAMADAEDDHPPLVHSLLLLSYAHYHSGMFAEAIRRSGEAAERAHELADPNLTSQVLTMSVMANCMHDNEFDAWDLDRAAELEDRDVDGPLQFRASAVRVLARAWTGPLDEADDGAIALRRLCLEHGAETGGVLAAVRSAVSELAARRQPLG